MEVSKFNSLDKNTKIIASSLRGSVDVTSSNPSFENNGISKSQRYPRNFYLSINRNCCVFFMEIFLNQKLFKGHAIIFLCLNGGLNEIVAVL